MFRGQVMRGSEAAKHIQHLASLGLRSQVVIPEMLNTLGEIVPGSFNSFFWVDRDGMLLDGYAPQVLLSAFDTLVSNYRELSPDEPTFDKIVAIGSDVGSAQRLHAQHDYSRSALVNEVWRPYGIGCGLDLVLREGGEARGILFVNRDANLSRFSTREHQALRSLAPHFLHALTGPQDIDFATDDSEERIGILIVHATGEILSASNDAIQLMRELTDRPFGPTTRPIISPDKVIPELMTLIRRHQRIRNGELTPPARWEGSTRRGAYRVKVFPQFASLATERLPESYSVIITQHLPHVLRLSRQVSGLDLSPRERQVAFRLGMGEDAEQGAVALGVSVATWRSYVKRIYQRLEIGSRGEFHAMLHAPRRRLN